MAFFSPCFGQVKRVACPLPHTFLVYGIPTEIIMIRIASEAEVLSYFKTAYSNRKHRYFGLYNSHANTITTD